MNTTSNSGQAQIIGYLNTGQPIYAFDPTARLLQPADEEPTTLRDVLDDLSDTAEELNDILNGYHAELQHLDSGCPCFIEGDESGRYAAQQREELLREMVVASEVLIQIKSVTAMAAEVL